MPRNSIRVANAYKANWQVTAEVFSTCFVVLFVQLVSFIPVPPDGRIHALLLALELYIYCSRTNIARTQGDRHIRIPMTSLRLSFRCRVRTATLRSTPKLNHWWRTVRKDSRCLSAGMCVVLRWHGGKVCSRSGSRWRIISHKPIWSALHWSRLRWLEAVLHVYTDWLLQHMPFSEVDNF